MKTIPHPNAVLYTEDILTAASTKAIINSGFTTVIVGLFHVIDDGTLVYNDVPMNDSLLTLIKSLKSTKGTSVKTVLFSIGGGNWYGHPASVSDFDYPKMKASWLSPAKGESKTSKQNMLDFLATADLDGLDLDYEPETTTFDAPFISTIANDIKAAGYMVTAAPYKNMPSWNTVIKNTVITKGDKVIGNNFSWWNLQLYGGAVYKTWIENLQEMATEIGMTNAELETFLLPGFTFENRDPDVETQISDFKKGYPSINGGFIWRYKFIAAKVSDVAASILKAIGA